MRAAAALISMALLGFGVLVGSGSSASSAVQARVKDRCVRGEWRMSNAASNAMLQSLIHTPNITIASGVLSAAFPRDGRMVYGTTHMVVKVEAGGLVMKGSATFNFEAGWQTANGKLILDAGRSELYIAKLSATKDGRTYTVDGPPPTRRRTDGGATPYTCSANTLRWKIPLNDTLATFRRVG
jgi:hypothetical protein